MSNNSLADLQNAEFKQAFDEFDKVICSCGDHVAVSSSPEINYLLGFAQNLNPPPAMINYDVCVFPDISKISYLGLRELIVLM